uniref:UDP-glucuronosyltransferase n=1 Tax=Sciurus vulgaris TaxID=55149 RepID=A0A8D2DVS6_SCIVU
MMFEKWVSTILLLQFCCVGCGFCGKVLVWPCEMSHWLNLKTILEELLQRRHEVTILTSSQTFLVDYHKPSAFNFEVIFVSGNQEDAEKSINYFLDLAVNIMPTLSLWESAKLFQNFFLEATEQFEEVCRKAVYNESLMEKLRETKYDVMVIDPVLSCGELVAELLGIPFVNTISCLPSYVPVSMGGLTDRMTFMERLKNMMFTLFFDFVLQQYDFQFWDQFYSEALGKRLCFSWYWLYSHLWTEIWLIQTYWDFEFPRPYLPNFEFVGGLHCKPAKPLPKEMEDFVQSSGEDGVVVFSLGSMVKNLREERANFIASALAQLPQKVLWRYKGKKPATLGANTRIFDWLPQNDLLGHPKTKAFITHGGTNGIYEAIYHGIPMVGIPMFADQPDNIAHMKAKGAAVEVNFNTMTSADLLSALRTVIYQPSYKENAMRLSRIHHDQPIKPLDRAVFWIEFVMRHKGYHSLDVIGFLLACVATAIFMVTKCCLFSCQKIVKTGKKKKRE